MTIALQCLFPLFFFFFYPRQAERRLNNNHRVFQNYKKIAMHKKTSVIHIVFDVSDCYLLCTFLILKIEFILTLPLSLGFLQLVSLVPEKATFQCLLFVVLSPPWSGITSLNFVLE